MKSFSLCQDLCPELIPVQISSRLGDGADGEVFEILNSTDKVIKFSILYEYSNPIDKEFERISNVLDFLQRTHPDTYAQVYENKKLIKSSRKTVSGLQDYILYYYIMEKCFKISDDEKKVFHTILSHEDRGIKKNYLDHEVKKILHGLSLGLDFDMKKIFSFYQSFQKVLINHSDIHPRNIMKDKLGNFKLIDFDRGELK